MKAKGLFGLSWINDRKDTVLLYMLIGLFLVVWVRNAWVADDALITFRVVQNFTHGNGLVYNLGDRVQVYTHPAWFFTLAFVHYLIAKVAIPLGIGFFTKYGGLYTSSLGLSLAFSLGAVWWLAFRTAASKKTVIWGVAALLLSKAFMDYSSSGLENPLTYFLIAVFAAVYFKDQLKEDRKIFLLALIAALGILNRMDIALLFAPALFYVYCKAQNKRGAIGMLAAGGLIFILWEVFSLFYYGFLFPNTAYAKLNTGIPSAALSAQGLRYFADSFRIDPITLTLIFLALVLPWAARRWQLAALSLGLSLYLLYIVKIGGDFMSGRFFAAPFFLSIIILTQFRWEGKWISFMVGLAVILLGLAGKHPPIFSGADYGRGDDFIAESGIGDERGFYFPRFGLLNVSAENMPLALIWDWEAWDSQDGITSVEQNNAMGVYGYQAGPAVHVFDRLALADALLARLPVKDVDKWRIGHFRRDIPDDLFASLLTGKNRIDSRPLRRYYNKLSIVIRGELFAPGRLTEIWKMNTGQYDHLIEKHIEQNE